MNAEQTAARHRAVKLGIPATLAQRRAIILDSGLIMSDHILGFRDDER